MANTEGLIKRVIGVIGLVTSPGIDFLKEKRYTVLHNVTPDNKWLEETYKCASGMLVKGSPGIPSRKNSSLELLKSAPNLKVISLHGVGYSWDLLEDCNDLKIWLAIPAIANYIAVTEHTFALMLSITRRIPYFDKRTRENDWEVSESAGGYDLYGKTLGLIGMGRIGGEVGRRAAECFGMKVIGYDPFIEKDKILSCIEQVQEVDDIFKRADIVSLHVNYTPEYDKFVNAEKFKMMKPTAFFINTARGGLVDEDALYEALSTKAIQGAAVDVLREEAPKTPSRLCTLDNFIITPHSAALTKETRDQSGLHAAMNIHSVFTEGKPIWPVNNIN